MIESRLKFYVYILPILTFSFPILLYSALFLKGGFSPDLPIYIVLFFSSLMLFCFLLLLFGELRTKAIYIRIEDDKIIVKRYLGLGSKREFKIDNFDGYTVSNLYSFSGIHEYLYLTKNGRKMIKISEFYHTNYLQLKEAIHSKVNFTGRTKFRMVDELTEIFK